jgi:hypothetical protein
MVPGTLYQFQGTPIWARSRCIGVYTSKLRSFWVFDVDGPSLGIGTIGSEQTAVLSSFLNPMMLIDGDEHRASSMAIYGRRFLTHIFIF